MGERYSCSGETKVRIGTEGKFEIEIRPYAPMTVERIIMNAPAKGMFEILYIQLGEFDLEIKTDAIEFSPQKPPSIKTWHYSHIDASRPGIIKGRYTGDASEPFKPGFDYTFVVTVQGQMVEWTKGSLKEKTYVIRKELFAGKAENIDEKIYPNEIFQATIVKFSTTPDFFSKVGLVQLKEIRFGIYGIGSEREGFNPQDASLTLYPDAFGRENQFTLVSPRHLIRLTAKYDGVIPEGLNAGDKFTAEWHIKGMAADF